MKNPLIALILTVVVVLAGFSLSAKAGQGEHNVVDANISTSTLALGTDTDSLTCKVEVDDITNSRSSFIDCADFMSSEGDTFTGNIVLDDGVTDSPNITFTDATDETAIFLKTDSSFLGLTTAAADGLNVLTGNLKVGNGTPGVTQNGEDAYIEGTLEVDGVTTLDGTLTLTTGFTEGGTAAELDRVIDDSDRNNSLTSSTAITCATHGTGQINYSSAAAATANITHTLPAATGSGCKYLFAWAAAPNSAAGETGDIIQVTGNDKFLGSVIMSADGGSSVVGFEITGDSDQLTFSSTQGAAQGGVFIEFWDSPVSDTYVIGPNNLVGTGTEATPAATGQVS